MLSLSSVIGIEVIHTKVLTTNQGRWRSRRIVMTINNSFSCKGYVHIGDRRYQTSLDLLICKRGAVVDV